MSLIIALDIDGVIANFTEKLLEQYNFLTNEGIKVSDLRSNKTSDYVGDPFTLKKIKDSVGFIRSLEPADGAIEAVEFLKKAGHDIFFLSNGTNCPTSGHEKRDWLNYYFSKTWKRVPLILTEDKFRARCDVLLDDDAKNFVGLHASTKPLLWHKSYNAGIVGFDRMYSWDQFIEWTEKNDIDQ